MELLIYCIVIVIISLIGVEQYVQSRRYIGKIGTCQLKCNDEAHLNIISNLCSWHVTF